MEIDNFAYGWLHEKEQEVKAAWTGSPPRFSSAVFTDVDISDTAFTLLDNVYFWYNQGPVGSCFANAVAQAIQISMSCAGLDTIQLSRAAVWYYGRLLDGMNGSRSDGGTITNAVRAIHEYGIPHESDWPYKPSNAWLNKKPPASVMQDAKAITISGLVDLNLGDTDGIKKTIKSGLPAVIGLWWRYGWDTNFNKDGIVSNSGGGTFGHALVIVGWATWNGKLFWNIINSHGPIYPTLTSEVAPTVKGYAGINGKSYSFWVSHTDLTTNVNYGNAEIVAPVGIIGPKSSKSLSWLLK